MLFSHFFPDPRVTENKEETGEWSKGEGGFGNEGAWLHVTCGLEHTLAVGEFWEGGEVPRIRSFVWSASTRPTNYDAGCWQGYREGGQIEGE